MSRPNWAEAWGRTLSALVALAEMPNVTRYDRERYQRRTPVAQRRLWLAVERERRERMNGAR